MKEGPSVCRRRWVTIPAMIRRAAFPALLCALLVIIGACGGGTDRVPVVERVADAVESRDSSALLDLIGYHEVACTTGEPGPQVPPCRAGEEDGALVDAVRMAQCEGAFLRPADVPNALEHLLDPQPEVYAAFKAPDTWDSGDYAVVLSSSTPAGRVASQLVIEGGKIVLLDFGCGESPEEKITDIDEDSFVIEPSEPSATPETT